MKSQCSAEVNRAQNETRTGVYRHTLEGMFGWSSVMVIPYYSEISFHCIITDNSVVRKIYLHKKFSWILYATDD
jgi:hypothetical protein